MLNEKKEREAFFLLLQSYKGLPRHKRLTKVLNMTGIKTGITKLENEFIRDKRVSEISEDLFYTIEEKSHVVDLCQKGHEFLGKYAGDSDIFILPDLSIILHDIDKQQISLKKKKSRKKLFIMIILTEVIKYIHYTSF